MVDVLTWQGKLAAALAAVEKAKRLDPRNSTDYRVQSGNSVYTAGTVSRRYCGSQELSGPLSSFSLGARVSCN